MNEVYNYLMHYGVKGMKWGKRKAPEETVGNPRTKKPTDATKKTTSKKVTTKRSEEEVEAAMKRLEKLERRERWRKAAMAVGIVDVILTAGKASYDYTYKNTTNSNRQNSNRQNSNRQNSNQQRTDRKYVDVDDYRVKK